MHNTVAIAHSACLNTVPWADNPNVTAAIAARLQGQESGNSVVDILYGVVNSSGKLPLRRSDISYWDMISEIWLVPRGDCDISEDLQMKGRGSLPSTRRLCRSDRIMESLPNSSNS